MPAKVFLLQLLPVLLLLLAVFLALWAWRWNRQRPLCAYRPDLLARAFRFTPDLRSLYWQRGCISRRELRAAIALNQRLLADELHRRRD